MPAAKEKIVVILPNHLGDVVMATPALRALRRGRPDAEIEAVLRAPLVPLLAGAPWLDRLRGHQIYEASGQLGRTLRRWRLGRELRGADAVLVLPNSLSAALLAVATGAARRIGYRRRARGALLTDLLPPPREERSRVPLAMERYYLDLMARLGCPDTGTELELFTDPEGERRCDALFAEHGVAPDRPLVAIAPGAGYGPAKRWPPRAFAEVARDLLTQDVQVALVHAPGEEALADALLAHVGPGPAPLRLGGAGMDLSLLKSVIARVNLLICNDAGARHVSAAFGVPTLVLFGPTSIRYTNLNLKLTRLLREPTACSPCQLKVCPIDQRCMTRIRPSRVVTEAQAALYDKGWRGDLRLELGA